MIAGHISTRRDECRHGEFRATYSVYDHHGNWRGDYTSWDRAAKKLKEIERIWSSVVAGVEA